MRPKKSPNEKLVRLTVYLLPKVLDEVQQWANKDRRTASETASLMIEHAIGCNNYHRGHVPADQIRYLRGQAKKDD